MKDKIEDLVKILNQRYIENLRENRENILSSDIGRIESRMCDRARHGFKNACVIFDYYYHDDMINYIINYFEARNFTITCKSDDKFGLRVDVYWNN